MQEIKSRSSFLCDDRRRLGTARGERGLHPTGTTSGARSGRRRSKSCGRGRGAALRLGPPVDPPTRRAPRRRGLCDSHDGDRAAFHPLPEPTDEQPARVTARIVRREFVLLRDGGVLCDNEGGLQVEDERSALDACRAAVVESRIAVGWSRDSRGGGAERYRPICRFSSSTARRHRARLSLDRAATDGRHRSEANRSIWLR